MLALSFALAAAYSAGPVLAARGPRARTASPHVCVRTAAPRAMHSDSRPTKEYMEFLLGENQPEDTVDVPSIIVGDGRVGALLAELGSCGGHEDTVVRRGDPIPELKAGGQLVRKPIYVTTRNEDLDAVIAACPEERREDLVFVQCGQIDPLRQRYGLYDTTQAVLWFAAVRRGGKVLDGLTDENPGGLSCVSGKWSGSLTMRLRAGDLKCECVQQRDLRRNMLEKLVWVCAFNLVGAVHGGITVGEVERDHRDEVEELIRELATFVRFTLSVALKTGLEERLCAYSRRVDFLPTSLTEFEWRNGYFYKYSLMAGKRTAANGIVIDMPDATPMHTEYLELAVERGALSKAELNSVASDNLRPLAQ